ncbi:hypothetical protein ACMT9Y_10805 [Clavibacter tessellarius]|uniref:hypothetical protein n=1 Tax=Clavibacter tessellarius TaxID=31965 RepID=UPI0039EBE462
MTAAVEGLTVTEGGGTAVETDDLTRIAARLDDEAGRLDDHARALALPPLVATITGDHDASLDAPRGLLSSAAHDARALAADLRRVAAEYADGERGVDRCVRSAAGDGAADAAPSSPGGPLRILLPAVVRDVVSDIAAAATRFLPARPAGDDGVRETTAGLLAALGAFGVLRDAPAMVHVRRDAVRPAPASLQDLADRIPDPVPGTPQMRVEEYRVPDGRRRFVAYFGGMVTMDPGTGREDFGPASAAAALATEGGSAVHAAETALRESGATAEDEVYVVGYSMGGILARSVGDDPGFHVTHELTFGSPVGQLPIRQGIDGVAVEHTDDPVPALGGVRPSDGDAGDDVVVRTPAFAPTVPAGVLDAHDLGTYRATATEMEASRSPLLERARDELHGFLDGASPVASHLYRAERAPLTPPGGSGGGM